MHIISAETAQFQSYRNKCKQTQVGVFNDRPIKEIFGAKMRFECAA